MYTELFCWTCNTIEQITHRDFKQYPNDGFVLPDGFGYCKPFSFGSFSKITGDVIYSRNIWNYTSFSEFPNARSFAYPKSWGEPPTHDMPWTPAGFVDNGDDTYTAYRYEEDMAIDEITSINIQGVNSQYNLWDNISANLLFNNDPNTRIDPSATFSWLRNKNGNWEEFSTSKTIDNIQLTPDWIGTTQIKAIVNVNSNSIESPPIYININNRNFASINFSNEKYTINENSTLTIEPQLTYYDNSDHSSETTFKWERYINNSWTEVSSDKTLNLSNIDLSWNNNKLRLKATYKDQEITSNEIIIVVVPKLIKNEIIGLNKSYVVGDNLSLSSRITFSDSQDHNSDITYSWEKYSNNSWTQIGDTNSLVINDLDLSWNNVKLRLKATYNGQETISDEVIIVVKEKPKLTNVEINGLNTSYLVGNNLSLSSSVSISDGLDHNGELTYKWEKKQENSNDWQTISTSSSFSQNSLNISWNNTLLD